MYINNIVCFLPYMMIFHYFLFSYFLVYLILQQFIQKTICNTLKSTSKLKNVVFNKETYFSRLPRLLEKFVISLSKNEINKQDDTVIKTCKISQTSIG